MKYARFKTNCGSILNTVHWNLALLPFLWLASLYTYAIRARLILGYWLCPYKPDPKTQILQDAKRGKN